MTSTRTLFLSGDVMLGRGIDHVLAHPGDPTLREGWADHAGVYVALAEARNGRVPRPVDAAWPWGDALAVLTEAAPDARVVNLETAVTRSDDFAAKAVCYRMNPANLDALAVAGPDVCVLANNHVLDFGRRGLAETLEVLAAAGLRTVGAGRDVTEATRPAVVGLPGGGRLVVLALGMASSGVPSSWAATRHRAGVAHVPYASAARAAEVVAHVQGVKEPGDVVVVSIHWGSNWGYDVPDEQVAFAHALVDGGVDVVHGHSSHHPRPVEVYRGRLILYGCGDLVNDYEGISGFEEYRSDLRLLHLATVDAGTGALAGLRMVPLRARRLRLERAAPADAAWLRSVLDDVSPPFGARVDAAPDGTLVLSR